MTTTDIAGLCERLWVGCIYMRDSSTNCVVDPEKTDALLAKAADTLERQAAEIKRLREALSGINQLARDRLALIPADLVCGGVVGDLLVDILGRAALTGANHD